LLLYRIIYAERVIKCLIPLNDDYVNTITAVREQLFSMINFMNEIVGAPSKNEKSVELHAAGKDALPRYFFVSLKKTCRKNDILFWHCLKDRRFSGAASPNSDNI